MCVCVEGGSARVKAVLLFCFLSVWEVESSCFIKAQLVEMLPVGFIFCALTAYFGPKWNSRVSMCICVPLKLSSAQFKSCKMQLF